MSGVSRNGSAECHEQKFVQMTVGKGLTMNKTESAAGVNT